MSRIPYLAILLALVACASPDPQVDRRDRYLSGYATSGPVEPAEYDYQDGAASPRFPSSSRLETWTVVEGETAGADESAPEVHDPTEDFGGAGIDGAGNEYRSNQYGGSGWGLFPGLPRPRPPRPQPR